MTNGRAILGLSFLGAYDVMDEFSPFYDRLLVSCNWAEEPSASAEALRSEASFKMDAIG